MASALLISLGGVFKVCILHKTVGDNDEGFLALVPKSQYAVGNTFVFRSQFPNIGIFLFFNLILVMPFLTRFILRRIISLDL
jgi:hypothetical protein